MKYPRYKYTSVKRGSYAVFRGCVYFILCYRIYTPKCASCLEVVIKKSSHCNNSEFCFSLPLQQIRYISKSKGLNIIFRHRTPVKYLFLNKGKMLASKNVVGIVFSLGEEALNWLPFLQLLLHSNQKINSVNHFLDKLHL